MGRRSEVTIFVLLFGGYFRNDVLCQSEDVKGLSSLIPDCVLGVQNVDYYFYNSNHPDGVILDLESETIPVEENVKTVFLIHGFTSEAKNAQYLALTRTLVDEYNVSVISVDWKKGACTSGGISITRMLAYPNAIVNTRGVGDRIAKFVGKLVNDHGINLTDVVVVGHSLGAQVAGFAGKYVQKHGPGTLPEILALDPAGPGFETTACTDRICVTDAELVQVFHTSFVAGMHREVGDIDFYFNGGASQPGCPLLKLAECSHTMAIEYLIDTLQHPECEFIGKKWKRSNFFQPSLACSNDTCSVAGLMAFQLPARGTFYVNTRNMSENCLRST